MIMSLRRHKWPHGIVLLSRNGRLPQPHIAGALMLKKPHITFEELSGKRLSKIFRQLRGLVRQGIPWQHAIDSVRPYTAKLWASLSAADKQRLLGKYYNLWNVHRHRIGDTVATELAQALAEGAVIIKRAAFTGIAAQTSNSITIRARAPYGDTFTQTASVVFDCRGLGLSLPQNALLQQLVKDGFALPSPTGVGLSPQDGFGFI